MEDAQTFSHVFWKTSKGIWKSGSLYFRYYNFICIQYIGSFSRADWIIIANKKKQIFDYTYIAAFAGLFIFSNH